MTDIDSRFRRRSHARLHDRLYWALGHQQTEAFFAQLLDGYGAMGSELARCIAQDEPQGIRACAIAKVEKHPEYAQAGSRAQVEGVTAGQVFNLGAGIVYAQTWAAAAPASLTRYREILGWPRS